jgi:D-methionine transport system substrate-binding protein
MLEDAELITLNDGVDEVSAKLSGRQGTTRRNVEFVEAGRRSAGPAPSTTSMPRSSTANKRSGSRTQPGQGTASSSSPAEDNPYGNFLAVRTENKDDENIKKLDELLHSPEVKEFIEDEWADGSVLPSF